eukprot:PhF_6_TR2004/c0_g1_i5/m.3403
MDVVVTGTLNNNYYYYFIKPSGISTSCQAKALFIAGTGSDILYSYSFVTRATNVVDTSEVAGVGGGNYVKNIVAPLGIAVINGTHMITTATHPGVPNQPILFVFTYGLLLLPQQPGTTTTDTMAALYVEANDTKANEYCDSNVVATDGDDFSGINGNRTSTVIATSVVLNSSLLALNYTTAFIPLNTTGTDNNNNNKNDTAAPPQPVVMSLPGFSSAHYGTFLGNAPRLMFISPYVPTGIFFLQDDRTTLIQMKDDWTTMVRNGDGLQQHPELAPLSGIKIWSVTCVDSQRCFFMDYGAGCIWLHSTVSKPGTLRLYTGIPTVRGNGYNVPLSQAYWKDPACMAYHRTYRRAYVTDTGNSAIKRFGMSFGVAGGSAGEGSGSGGLVVILTTFLTSVVSIAQRHGYLYGQDLNGIKKVNVISGALSLFPIDNVVRPTALYYDCMRDNLYIADDSPRAVWQYSFPSAKAVRIIRNISVSSIQGIEMYDNGQGLVVMGGSPAAPSRTGIDWFPMTASDSSSSSLIQNEMCSYPQYATPTPSVSNSLGDAIPHGEGITTSIVVTAVQYKPKSWCPSNTLCLEPQHFYGVDMVSSENASSQYTLYKFSPTTPVGNYTVLLTDPAAYTEPGYEPYGAVYRMEYMGLRDFDTSICSSCRGVQAMIIQPYGIHTWNRTQYIADGGAHVIFMATRSKLVVLAGGYGERGNVYNTDALSARFDTPVDTCWMPETDVMYIVDRENYALKALDLKNGLNYVTQTARAVLFTKLMGLVCYKRKVFVGSDTHNKIYWVDPLVGTLVEFTSKVTKPMAMSLDARGGTVYIAEEGAGRVSVMPLYDASGLKAVYPVISSSNTSSSSSSVYTGLVLDAPRGVFYAPDVKVAGCTKVMNRLYVVGRKGQVVVLHMDNLPCGVLPSSTKAPTAAPTTTIPPTTTVQPTNPPTPPPPTSTTIRNNSTTNGTTDNNTTTLTNNVTNTNSTNHTTNIPSTNTTNSSSSNTNSSNSTTNTTNNNNNITTTPTKVPPPTRPPTTTSSSPSSSSTTNQTNTSSSISFDDATTPHPAGPPQSDPYAVSSSTSGGSGGGVFQENQGFMIGIIVSVAAVVCVLLLWRLWKGRDGSKQKDTEKDRGDNGVLLESVKKQKNQNKKYATSRKDKEEMLM